MLKVFISTTSFGKYDDAPLRKLRERGIDVLLNPFGRKMTPDECIVSYADIDGLIAGTETLNEKVLTSARRLRVVSRCGVGLDGVDLDAASRLGIRVLNTPDAPTLPVAELTVGLMLSLLRRLGEMDGDLRAGKWRKLMGSLLYGKKVGIVGLGRIGAKVSELLGCLGADCAYYDVEKKDTNIKMMGLDGLLGWADIVTLHISRPGGKPLIGAKELSLMRAGAWLINVSRGGVVDEGALYDALKEGRLSGAALDVFEKEPYEGPLRELNNVILTPHIGSYAKEGRMRMEAESVDNLLTGLEESGLLE